MAIKVSTISDYKLFKPSFDNRSVNEKHVAELMDSMKTWGFLPSCAIRVHKNGDGRFIIDDGQHRFTAAQRLGIGVYYIADESTVPAHITSGLQRKWQPIDFASAYANQGKEPYQFLVNFSEQNKLPTIVAATLLSGQFGGGRDSVRDGSFKVTHADLAQSIVELAEVLIKSGLKEAKTHHCLLALRTISGIKEFNRYLMIERIRSNPAILVKQAGKDGYVKMLDTIYNYRSRTSDRLPLWAKAQELMREMNVNRVEKFKMSRKRK
jgi:hypothetical protein